MNVPIIKQVPPECIGGKTLFCSDHGKFFSAAGRELKPHFTPGMQKNRPNMHSAYPCMRNFSNRLCHHLVWETFVGPRTKGLEIDHINGNKLDWSLANLEEVTPAENRRRAKYLRALRQLIPLHAQTFTREDYQRFFAMPFEDFQAMLAKFHREDPAQIMTYEMTHHMEY